MPAATADLRIQLLTFADAALMEDMLAMFGEAFGEVETYGDARPGRPILSGCSAATSSSRWRR